MQCVNLHEEKRTGASARFLAPREHYRGGAFGDTDQLQEENPEAPSEHVGLWTMGDIQKEMPRRQTHSQDLELLVYLPVIIYLLLWKGSPCPSP